MILRDTYEKAVTAMKIEHENILNFHILNGNIHYDQKESAA